MPCLVRVVVLDKSEAAAQSPREASFARQPQEAGCTALLQRWASHEPAPAYRTRPSGASPRAGGYVSWRAYS